MEATRIFRYLDAWCGAADKGTTMTKSDMLQLLQQLKQAYTEQEPLDERYKFAAAAIDDAVSALDSGKVSIKKVQNVESEYAFIPIIEQKFS